MELKNQLCCDLSSSSYLIIHQVCVEDFKMKPKQHETEEWELRWTDSTILPEDLIHMKKYQKINHFPGMYILSRKNFLAMHLSKLQKRFPADYNFFPKTWTAPIKKFELKVHLSTNSGSYFIVKPEVGSQGRGIFLTRNLEEIDLKRHLVQEYIDNPYLINGLKFDLRLYVLVTGCDPLRIFVFKEGFARFATEQYDLPNMRNFSNNFMHLTNYAINRHSELYINNTFAARDDIGHKRSFSSVLKYLRSKGEDTDAMLSRIDDIVVKSLIPAQPTLSHYYSACQPDEHSNSMCFEILGFDIFLDSDLNPYLLEVNSTPSFAASSPLDSKVKKKLVFDTLKLVNVSLKDKEKWIDRDRFIRIQKVLFGNGWRLSKEEKKMIKERLAERRTEWENENLGEFRRVYPRGGMEKYEKFLMEAGEVWGKFTGIRKKEVKDEVVNMKQTTYSSFMKMSSSMEVEEVFRRLSKPALRVVKTKMMNKIMYQSVGSLNLIRLSPLAVEKIKLIKKNSDEGVKNMKKNANK